MKQMTVYIGSGYVIKTPDFDFRQNSLRVSADASDARKRACTEGTVGIINTYRLNLDNLTVSRDGSTDADVSFSADESSLSLQSERALQSLSFVSAGFVMQ